MNHQPESRVREIRTHGSEGGGTGYSTGPSYLYQYCATATRFAMHPRARGCVTVYAAFEYAGRVLQ